MSTFNSFPAVIDNPLAIDPIDSTDADALIDALEQFKKVEGELQAAKTFCIRALVAMTDSDARTRRVQGRRRAVAIEMPGTNWNNSKLKEAWNSYPQFREKYLRISSIDPQLREVNKLRETNGPPDLETFKAIVFSAECEATRNPTVKIEV